MDFTFEITNNFWTTYPELRLHFSKVYGDDTSKDKKKSSTLMWAFLLYCHPESKLYNAPNKGDTIAETVLKDKEFKWEEKSYIMDDLTEIVLSEAEKALVSWNDTMRLRRLNLNEMYVDAFQAKDTDELVKIDKMMASTSKFFEDYRKIKKDYEDDKIRKTGKTIASLSDNDDI